MDYVRGQLDALPQVTVRQSAADDFSAIEPGAFDVVVLNSVVQYFPGAAYLERVLRGAVAAVRPGGHLFVGDVRSLSLWEAFHTSVEVAWARPGARREDIQDGVRRRLAAGARAGGRRRSSLPDLPRACQGSRAWRCNSVAAGRRTSWLPSGMTCGWWSKVAARRSTPLEELRWDRVGSVSALRTPLAERDPDALVVRGVPNARVTEAVAALAWLRGGAAPSTVGAWRQLWAQTQPAGVEPEAIWEMAGGVGLRGPCGLGRHSRYYGRAAAQDNGREPPQWPRAGSGSSGCTRRFVRTQTIRSEEKRTNGSSRFCATTCASGCLNTWCLRPS